MLESMIFTYDGISSNDLGTVMINPSSGLYQETFLPTRSINETKVNGRPKPYFKGVDIEPLSFPISLFIEGWRERKNLREIARWLFKPYYKPLFFQSSPEQIYYAMFIGNSELLHNGCRDGYITLEVRCDSPFRYSPIKSYDFKVVGTHSATLFNEGDILIRPNLKVIQHGTADIKIKNNANGQELIITGIQDNEILEIDCANETITSSLEYLNIYRYNNVNDVWLDFNGNSVATFTFTGNFDVKFCLEYAYLAEDNPIFFD